MKRLLAAGIGRRPGGRLRRIGRRLLRHAGLRQLLGAQLRGQRVPLQLEFNTIGQRAGHGAPVVNRAGGARRNARHAQIALVGVDDVVAVVVRDRVDGAGRLAGVAADADLGVDEMLLLGGRGAVHGVVLVKPSLQEAIGGGAIHRPRS